MTPLYEKGSKVLIVGPSKNPNRSSWIRQMNDYIGLVGEIVGKPEKSLGGFRYKVTTDINSLPGWWYWDDEISHIGIRCRL